MTLAVSLSVGRKIKDRFSRDTRGESDSRRRGRRGGQTFLGSQRPRELFDSAMRALVSQVAGSFDDDQRTFCGVPLSQASQTVQVILLPQREHMTSVLSLSLSSSAGKGPRSSLAMALSLLAGWACRIVSS